MNGYSIALVYDLRSEYLALGYAEEAVAEFDSEETVELIAAALTRLGHRVTRIGNGRALARSLANGGFYDLVLSIAEGLSGRAREAQVPALCELYDQPYVFSDPMTMAVALDKSAAKRLVRDAGVATAPFVVVAGGERVPTLNFDYPVFAKPVSEGTGKGCEHASICYGPGELATAVGDLSGRFRQPVLIEPYLPGREFTVAIVDVAGGPEVAGMLEIVLRDGADVGVYSYRNKERCEHLVDYRVAGGEVAERAAVCALDAYRALGCRDAARIDVRCDAGGEPFFLEANPLAGLHPTHSDLPMAVARAGHSYDWLLNAIVTSAARRYGLEQSRPRDPGDSRPFVPVMHAAEGDRADEEDTLETAERVCMALERAGYASEVSRFVPEANALGQLARRAPKAVFNLVEAIGGDTAAGLIAPWYLSRYGLAYTGCSFEACLGTASKLLAKALLQAHGLPSPAVVDRGDGFRGQVILKPDGEHASVGIDGASVMPAANMARALAEREAQYGQRFFAETYVPGREFNVALIEGRTGARVLPIQETLFVDWPEERARVVGFDAKWEPKSLAYRNTPRCFGIEVSEPVLAAALAGRALAVWTVFGLSGYARVDVRLDAAGTLFVIDVNANPGLGPDAGFVAAAAEAGIDFENLITMLVDAAAARRELR